MPMSGSIQGMDRAVALRRLTSLLLVAGAIGMLGPRIARGQQAEAGQTAPQAEAAPAAAEAAPAAAAAPEDAASMPPSRKPRHRAHRSNVDDRLALLTAELKLDANQRDAVRKILENQRLQTQKVWSDASVPSSLRVKSTQAIGDRTAQQIREVLNDEQRGRYIKPLPEGVRNTALSASVDSYARPGTGARK